MKKQAQAHTNVVEYSTTSGGKTRPEGNLPPVTPTERSQVSELSYALKLIIKSLQSGNEEKASRLWKANEQAFISEVNNALDPNSMVGLQDKELVNNTIPKTWLKPKLAQLANGFEKKYFTKRAEKHIGAEYLNNFESVGEPIAFMADGLQLIYENLEQETSIFPPEKKTQLNKIIAEKMGLLRKWAGEMDLLDEEEKRIWDSL